MNTGIVWDLASRLVSITKKHTPEILAGIGIGGFVTTAVLAAKAAPVAAKKIEETKEELQAEELTTVQTVKAVWKDYVPAVTTGIASTLCIVGSVNTSLKRNAALATAYEMSRTLMEEYRAKTLEVVGEKKERKIQDAITQDRIDKNPPVQNVNVIHSDEDGKIKKLVQEPMTGKYILVDDLSEIKYAIAQGYDLQSNSTFENMSAYEWFNILDPSITDDMTDTQIDIWMNSYWSRDYPYEGFSCELNMEPFNVKSGKWKDCPCYEIRYGSHPRFSEYERAY